MSLPAAGASPKTPSRRFVRSAYRPPVKPVAPARFRLDVNVGQEAHDALRFLQDMLAREIAGGDVSKVVEHCADRSRPRGAPEDDGGHE